MKEIGVLQAQAEFTTILSNNENVLIVDKKTKTKKAVILSYKDYQRLIKLLLQSINTSLQTWV